VIQKLVEALGNLGGQELGVQPGARVAITRRHGLRLPIRSWDKRIPAAFILIGVDVQDVDDVAQALMEIGTQQALDAWAACTSRPDNTMGSVYGTAETLLDVYGDPVIAQSAEGCDLDLDELVTGAPAANRPAGHIAGDLLSRQQSSVLAGRRCCAFPIRRQATMDRPTLIGPEALHRPAAETPGVDRREAFADDHVWAGRSRTDAGTWSGWHVHPGHDTYVFQTEGRLRLEFGPGGTQSVEGGPGDFVLIPKGVVHREGNPGTEPNEAIVFRVGEGEVLVNLEGP
jgi:uncharacterized RmlC-like cupin family protein